ncbi:aldo/keto reductase [Duganella sp. HSC-15S17]|uniref:Aldo/keto reductase n=1 Tax=Duganella violaceipulchra TaxID=2849652 RepID=A0AA41L1Y8_9BURK|nr:aldo/keto reductase [Duganella violaceicalia]
MSTPVPRIALSAEGPTLSRITFGCWRMAGWRQTPQQRLALIEQALELGITSFDHADIYTSEEPFGVALAAAPHLRQRMEIVSKCGIYGGLYGARVPHYNTGRAHIVASVEQSLRQLNTDYLDLLLIHRPDPLMDADEVAEAFSVLRAAGKVRHFGASNFNPAQFELLNERVTLVTNQIEFSPLCLAPLGDGTLDQAQRLRRRPMIWSPLAGGRLFDHPAIAALLEELAARYGVTPGIIAYAWLLRHPSQPVVLTGSSRVEALREAAVAASVTLERQDWFALLRATTGTDVP